MVFGDGLGEVCLHAWAQMYDEVADAVWVVTKGKLVAVSGVCVNAEVKMFQLRLIVWLAR